MDCLIEVDAASPDDTKVGDPPPTRLDGASECSNNDESLDTPKYPGGLEETKNVTTLVRSGKIYDNPLPHTTFT